MKNIYVYQNCLSLKGQLDDLKANLKEYQFIDFDSLTVVRPKLHTCSICIFSLDQAYALARKELALLMQLVDVFKFIVLVHPSQHRIIFRMMKTGTKGVLLHDDPLEIFEDGIRHTDTYGGYISPRIVARLNKENKFLVQLQPKITMKQRNIIRQLLEGKSDKMIAADLNISYQTMRTHRKNIYRLFNVRSQGEFYALMH